MAVIGAGALACALLVPRAHFSPVGPFLLLLVLSSLTSALKVKLPIASGAAMSVSYVVDIAALLLWGPHATMILGAASGWSQTTFNTATKNPTYRVLFNMACLVLTVQAAGQVFLRLGGNMHGPLLPLLLPLGAMAVTYFFANTIPIAVAIALTTTQSAWRVWRTEFASSLPSYVLGAASAAVVLQVTESSGYGLTALVTAAPLYLTYRVYRAGVETEARQGAILEAAHDAIITIDQRLNIREFNPAAEHMFGRARLDVLGRSVDLLLPASERTEVLSAFATYLQSGAGRLAGRHQLELKGVRGDGTEFPIEVSVARVGSDSRAVLTAFIRDITERRALEEQLRQSQKLEAIGRLASGVAHDFNNILMSIMGSADLLLMLMDPAAPERDELVEVKQSVDRGAGLTRQLLAFSRRQSTHARDFALAATVNGMHTMLRRLIGPEIELAITCQPEPIIVHADAAQIEQVVLNLAINARDAMPEGGRLAITLDDVELDEEAALPLTEGNAGHYARLCVSDTGTGIDEQTRARLFEPFFTTKQQGKGTGLGLSIVYGIVRQSGGYIAVSSEVGRGASFQIYLPIVDAAAPAGR